MSSRPALLDAADLSRQRAEDAQYYREVLHKLIAMGTDLAGAVHRQATAEPSAAPDQGQAREPAAVPLPNAAVAFDRIARTVRRTILLARKLSEPDRAPNKEHAGERRPAAPKRPRDAGSMTAEPLSPELLDRIDAIAREDEFGEFGDLDLDPELDGDLGQQTLASFVARIRRDLDLAVPPGTPICKPRTPEDVWALCVRAAQLAAAETPEAQPAARPVPDIPCPDYLRSTSLSTTTGPPRP